MTKRAIALLLVLPLLAGCTGFGERLLAPGLDGDLATFFDEAFPTSYEARVRWEPDGGENLYETCVTVTDDVAVTDGAHPPFAGPTGEPLAMTLTAIQAMARAVDADEDDGLRVAVPPPVPGKVSLFIGTSLTDPVWVAVIEVDGCDS